jgi:alpha-tubulin suppressor-like RCC1 family protein
LGNPDVESERLPKPIEALRGVRVGSVAIARRRSYAVADTGELWAAWGYSRRGLPPLGHGEQAHCLLPKVVAALRRVKLDAVTVADGHSLVLAGDGKLYAWGHYNQTKSGTLGLGPAVKSKKSTVHKPRRVPALRVACGL